MKTVKQILQEARERISDPLKWTQQVNARNAEGHDTPYDSQVATCWCVFGALQLAGREFPLNAFAAENLLDNTIRAQYGEALIKDEEGFSIRPMAWLNDDRGHQAVIVALDLAIAQASTEI